MSRLILRGARFPGDIAIEDGKIAGLGTIEALGETLGLIVEEIF